MIELGALLGAVAATHLVLNHMRPDEAESFWAALFWSPVLGALWGAVVAAIIHFTANGVLLGLVLSVVAHHGGH